jgi:hypothetical protein
MKSAISLVIACLFCLVAIPAEASSFGLSPALVTANISGGISKPFQFTVIGYSGLVKISTEGMPTTVTPSSITVVAETPITVTITCNNGAIPGTYSGRIKFVAESGNNVLAGVNVICYLIVPGASDNITLTTTVIGNGGGGGGGGGITNNGSFPYTPPDWASIFPSMNQRGSSAQVDNRPVQQNPPIYIPPVIPQSTRDAQFDANSNQVADPNKEPFKIDWFLLVCLGLILISGTIVVILLIRSRRQY